MQTDILLLILGNIVALSTEQHNLEISGKLLNTAQEISMQSTEFRRTMCRLISLSKEGFFLIYRASWRFKT